MKSKWILLISGILALSLCACGEPVSEDTSKTEVTTEIFVSSDTENLTKTVEDTTFADETSAAPEPISVDFTGDSGFKLITATANATSTNLSTVVNALITQLKNKTNIKYSVANDNGTATGLPELIIGKGKRPGIDELYATLGPADYVVAVIRDAVVILGGSPDATAKAGTWFISNCIVKNIFTYEGGELYRYTSPDKLPEPSYKVDPNYFAEKLKGLTVYAIGDSYFAGEGLNPKTEVWPALMAKKYNWNFENYGKGGSTVSDYITTNTPMCRRISDMKDGSPDIVLFEGGANDWNHSIPLGDKGSKDTKTFRGAVASCIEQLHAKYPNAVIVCISNWEYGQEKSGVQTTAFAKAMVDVAKEYSYTIAVDASDVNIIPAFVTSSVFRMKYSIKADDKNHLNVEGMQYIMPYFEKIIGDNYK